MVDIILSVIYWKLFLLIQPAKSQKMKLMTMTKNGRAAKKASLR